MKSKPQTLARRLSFLTPMVVLCAGVFAWAADWPRFRGADHTNISTETGLLREWPAGGPKLAWKISGVGMGTSSVAVVGGRIYTMGDLAGKANVICLSAADGKQLWAVPIGRGGGSDTKSGRPGTHCTPTVDGERVYALAQFGQLACLNAADGKVIWTKDLQKDLGGAKGRWDYAESPLIDGEQLVCTPGGPKGTMAALNKTTGDVIWRSTAWTDNAQYVTPIIATIDGVKQYIQFTGRSVAGVSASDGKVLWLAPREGRTAIAASPVYADNTVLVSSGYGVGSNVFKVTGTDGTFTAEPGHASRDVASHHGGMVLHEGHVYLAADNGMLMCVNLKSGQPAWRERLCKGSMTMADGMLYVRSEDGPIALVEATPTAFRLKGKFDQPARSNTPAWAYPVVADGKLYIRDDDKLLCYDVKGWRSR